MKEKKIIIIGAGNVGSHIASAILWKGIPVEVILVDQCDKFEKAQVMDLKDLSIIKNKTKISGGDFGDGQVNDGDIFIITAGAKQKEGETRLDLLQKNMEILKDIKKSLGEIKKTAMVILVANPVDILTYEAWKIFNLSKKQVFGSGTYLDTLRLRWRLLDGRFSKKEIKNVCVLGEHGDSSFVYWDKLDEKIDTNEREKIESEVKREAYQIIEGKGSTYFGIGGVVAEIVEILISGKKKKIPLSVVLENEKVAISLLTLLGRGGIKKVIPLKFNQKTEKKFKNSLEILKSLV